MRTNPARSSGTPVTVIDLIEQSAMMRGLSRIMRRVETAARSSAVLAQAAAITEAWRHLDRSTRLRATGIALLTAVAVHVALQWIQYPPVSWLWLVIPGIALAQALLLIAASIAPAPDHS